MGNPWWWKIYLLCDATCYIWLFFFPSNTLSDIAISRCGGLSNGRISDEIFQNSQISFAEFCSNPELLAHPDIVVRVNNKWEMMQAHTTQVTMWLYIRYYGWQVAAPMIMSCLVYMQTLPESSMNILMKSKKVMVCCIVLGIALNMFGYLMGSYMWCWSFNTKLVFYGFVYFLIIYFFA